MTLDVAVRHEGDVADVSVTGDLDIVTELPFRAAIEDVLADARQPKAITVDLSGVPFLDSSGLRALLLGHAQAAAAGIEFRVVDPSPSVAYVLQLTQVGPLLGVDLPVERRRPSRPG